MPKKRGQLKAVLSPHARRDLRDALSWSEKKFGHEAKLRYETLLVQALRDIESEPSCPGSAQRPEIMINGARTYHISLSRTHVSGPRVKEPRHFILYRRHQSDNVIDVGRILHDGRDLASHLPGDYFPHE